MVHSRDFHDYIEILDGFEFYDRTVDCKLSSCVSNKINRHFHCTRPNCNYSFVQYSTMVIHNQKHIEGEMVEESIKTEYHPEEKHEPNDVQMKAVNLSSTGEKLSGRYCSGHLKEIMENINNTFHYSFEMISKKISLQELVKYADE